MADEIFVLYSREPPNTKARFHGWLHAPYHHGAAMGLRVDAHNRFGEKSQQRGYDLVHQGRVSATARAAAAVKGVAGISRWYELFWLPLGTAREPGAMIAAAQPFGYFWGDRLAIGDIICDLAVMPAVPDLIARDVRNGEWILMPAHLSTIWWPPAYTAWSLFFGRKCR